MPDVRPHELKETGSVVCHVDEFVNGHWTTILTTRDEAFADQLAKSFGKVGRVEKYRDDVRKRASAKRLKRGKRKC